MLYLATNPDLEARTAELVASDAELKVLYLATNPDLEARTAELVASDAELEVRTAELVASNVELEASDADLEARTAELVVSDAELEARTAQLVSSNAELEARTAQLVSSNAELEARTAQLVSSNAELEARTAQLVSSNAELEARTSELVASNVELEASNADLEARTAQLVASNVELEASNAELEARTSELVASNAELEARTAQLVASNTELEARTAQLVASNAELEARTAQLVASNADLEASNAELEARTAQLVASNADLEARTGQFVASNADLEGRTAQLVASNAELERFRLLAENAADVVYRYQLLPELELEYISSAVTTVTGYTPEEHYADPGLSAKIVHPDDQLLWERTVPDPSPEPVAVRWIGKDGEVVWMEHRNVGVRDEEGRLVAIEGIARDITPRTRLEEQLRHGQKLEAVGRLAGGISHDFNNLLLVIRGNCELALRGLAEGDPRHDELGEIKVAAERAAALTRQLLAFSRKQVVEPRALDLNATVTNMERMFHLLIGEDVKLVTVLDPGLAPVNGDQGQIEQVVVNLVVNSRDAMGSGGRLTIRTENVRPGAAVPPHGIEAPERAVLLSVTDTGTGMNDATRAHLFEPYFTTKTAGEGTGLGLATVFGIVEQAGGWIEVASELGKGSTFTVFLPGGGIDAPEAEITRPAASGGSETLLLVEDNEQVRRLVRLMLEAAGYTVLEAATGMEALAVARRHDERIGLLLSDVVMPEMGAQELLEHLLPLRPGLPVLLMSGYVEGAITDLRDARAGAAFLQKPFTADALLASVREALARASTGEIS